MTRLLASLLLALACTGCSTSLYGPNGQPLLRTYANAASLDYSNSREGIEFHVRGLNHSTPTRAGGSIVGTAATGLTGIITAAATRGSVR